MMKDFTIEKDVYKRQILFWTKGRCVKFTLPDLRLQ